jgi:hypothetical protein
MTPDKRNKTKGVKKAYIGVKVPAEHASQLKAMARAMDVTVSQLFRRMVRESIKRELGAEPI